jgi:hypothetical protein
VPAESYENPTNLIAKEERGAPAERVGRHRQRVVRDLHAADVAPPLILQETARKYKSRARKRRDGDSEKDLGLGFRV